MLSDLFSRFAKREPIPEPGASTVSTANIDFNSLEILNADQLISLLCVENILRSIKRLVAISDVHWETLYLPAIEKFIEYSQLVPASIAHHHAGPGGLITHTLESLEISLQIRKTLVLPKFADPDQISKEAHIHTYAVFIAVLFHDIGKLSTTTIINLSNGLPWNPHINIDALKGIPYQVEFVHSPYKLHQRVATIGFAMLPKQGISWLNQFPEILSQVSASLYGDHFESGIIGEIAQQADSQSVSRNLKEGGDRIRFPNAPNIPLIDRLIIALRTMLSTNELKLNANGADGWTDEDHLWLVCGTVVNKLVAHLHEQGFNTVPTDNNRIFDIFQDHDAVVLNDKGKAIWQTKIIGPDSSYSFELTMLKFKKNMLLTPNRRKFIFPGEIIVDTNNEPDNHDTTNSDSNGIGTIASDSPTHNSDTTQALNETAPTTSDATTSTHEPAQSNTHGATDLVETSEPANETDNSEEFPLSEVVPAWMNQDAVSDTPPDTRSETAPPTQNPTSATETTSGLNFEDIKPSNLDDNTGQYFMDWLSRMIKYEKLRVNARNALIHTVPEGILVVSPAAFKEFVTHFDVFRRQDDSLLTLNDAAKVVQKKVEKLRKNIRTSKGMAIHTYYVNGKNRQSRISGFLFDTITIYGELKPPAPNSHISLNKENPKNP